jgi:hypothetical protein
MRIAYQANVLVEDTTPDLDSILVRPAGSSAAFDTTTQVEIGSAWEYQLTLTGPVVGPPISVTLDSDGANVPIGPPGSPGQERREFQPGQESGSWATPPTPNDAHENIYTITAFGQRVTKTATVRLYRLK